MYIVIEIQKNSEGVVSPLVFTFNTKSEAESKYYIILSYAALSDLPRHGALLFCEDHYLKGEMYRRDTTSGPE